MTVTYHRRNRFMMRLGLCAAGGLVLGGVLAIPFSGSDDPGGGAGASATSTTVVVTPAPSGSLASTPTTAAAPTTVVVTTSTVPATTVAIPVASAGSDPSTSPSTSTSVDPPSSPVATDVPTIAGVDAPAYVLIDADTGEVLAGSNADEQRPVASLTKLLTAYVVMQAGDPTKLVTVPHLDTIQDESIIGLAPGMKYTREVLLRAMLVVSAGDAAETLAIDVAGSEEAFVEQMNQAAQSLGLANTVAVNETGLDADGAHSSAADVAQLSRVLMQDPTFRDTVDNRTAKLFGKTFSSTNLPFLKGYAGATGVKTGHTTDAGYSLAASATRDGRSLIAVVLGTGSAAERAAQAEAVLDWGFAQAG